MREDATTYIGFYLSQRWLDFRLGFTALQPFPKSSTQFTSFNYHSIDTKRHSGARHLPKLVGARVRVGAAPRPSQVAWLNGA